MKRFVKALVTNSFGTNRQLTRGAIVTLDLTSVQDVLGDYMVEIVGDPQPWFLHRFAIDPLAK